MVNQVLSPRRASAIIALGMVFLLGACIDLVTNVELPDQEPKVVVHSFISPADSAVQVLLSWSRPASHQGNNQYINFIENAQVRIGTDGVEWQSLTWHPARKIYSLSTGDFSIEAGQHYHLSVDVPGQAHISASCYVPHANTSLQLDDIYFTSAPPDWMTRPGEVIFSFLDSPADQLNYYALSAWEDSWWYDWESDEYSQVRTRLDLVYGERLISNQNRQGRRFAQRASFYRSEEDINNPFPGLIESDSIYLLLLTTDEHYYRYHRALENYTEDNPFTEPVMVYSNIEGGLGIFAGFSRFEVTVEIPD